VCGWAILTGSDPILIGAFYLGLITVLDTPCARFLPREPEVPLGRAVVQAPVCFARCETLHHPLA